MAGKFGRGAVNAQQAVKENKPSGSFDRTEYFKLDDGESLYMRLIDDGDEWLYMKVHAYIPAKPEPKWWTEVQKGRDDGDKRKFPDRMDAGCRRDKAFEYGECFVCDTMHEYVQPKGKAKKWYPQIRYFVPAVLREEVIGTQEMIDAGQIPATKKVRGEDVSTVGRVVGRRDVMVDKQILNKEGEPTGETKSVPKVVLIKQGYDNFFATLQGIWESSGDDEDGEVTLLNRDIKVTREGKGTETKYHFKEMAIDRKHDLRDPETRKAYLGLIDVEKIMEDSASDEYFAKFIDRSVDWKPPAEDDGQGEIVKAKGGPPSEPVSNDGSTSGGSRTAKPSETAPPADDGDDEEEADVQASMAALKGRLKKTNGRKADAEEAPAPDTSGDDEDDE